MSCSDILHTILLKLSYLHFAAARATVAVQTREHVLAATRGELAPGNVKNYLPAVGFGLFPAFFRRSLFFP